MAEEHRCQAPEGHRLCINNCGFLGSPATMNLCSKCYRDFCLKEQLDASAVKPSSSLLSPESVSSPAQPSLTLPEVNSDANADKAASPLRQQQPNRCMVCRRRVGLTGFRCRCGITFCGTHRYPEEHGCAFDFKRLGREEIGKANPLVKAEKLQKI